MTNRSRAWRRRKARLIVGKIQSTKNWLLKRFEDQNVASDIVVKPRKVAKKTRAQDLRRAWQLNEDLVEGTAG